MPASTKVNEFQKAVLESFRDGEYASLAGVADYRKLLGKLAKDSLVRALIVDLHGVESVSEASTRVLDFEIGVKSALQAVGAVAMARTSSPR